jgi:hypothetical protein
MGRSSAGQCRLADAARAGQRHQPAVALQEEALDPHLVQLAAKEVGHRQFRFRLGQWWGVIREAGQA